MGLCRALIICVGTIKVTIGLIIIAVWVIMIAIGAILISIGPKMAPGWPEMATYKGLKGALSRYHATPQQTVSRYRGQARWQAGAPPPLLFVLGGLSKPRCSRNN